MNLPKSEMSKQEALQLWSTCRSEYAKEQMILSNYRIVFSIMKRLGIPAFDEDMFQVGVIGLLNAIDTFDVSKGYQFSTYAFPIVRNELLMELRKRRKSVKAEFSLDDNADIGNGESIPYADMISDGKDYEENVLNSIFIQQIFEGLSSKEKQIFKIFFLENNTQCEIAEELGISQSYISRIIKGMGKTKKKGREKYENNQPGRHD